MEKKTFLITTKYSGRLDSYLAENTDFSRSHIKKMCDEGNVLLNGCPAKANKPLKINDLVEILVTEPKNLDLQPENIELDIIYQDQDIAVINKPQGMVVHAGSGTKGSTLVNALLYHLDKLSGINGVVRPGIVHRIDKNTSGLLVVAKNDNAHIKLAKQLEDKTCSRKYYALLEGIVKDDKGTISTFIDRSQKDRKKMAVSSSGRFAVTNYKVVKRYSEHTLCEFSLETGRTHQIRVHAKHIGHPVVGDMEYGYKKQKFKLDGQLLHAYKLEFVHPTTNKKVVFECPLPQYFENLLKKLN